MIRHLLISSYQLIWFSLKAILVISWAIWGLLGSLPGGSILKTAIAVTLLYTTGIVHVIAMYFGVDITLIDIAIGKVPDIWNKVGGIFG